MKAIWIMFLASGIAACATDEPAQAELEQAEIIEVHGCRPGYWDVGDGTCVDPWPGGGGGGPGPTGGEPGPGGPGGPGPGGGGGGGGSFDPEPDRNKDRKSCWDWCDWDRRQCELECKHRHPERDMNERNRCIRSCNRKRNACTADCNSRFPERPITVSP